MEANITTREMFYTQVEIIDDKITYVSVIFDDSRPNNQKEVDAKNDDFVEKLNFFLTSEYPASRAYGKKVVDFLNSSFNHIKVTKTVVYDHPVIGDYLRFELHHTSTDEVFIFKFTLG